MKPSLRDPQEISIAKENPSGKKPEFVKSLGRGLGYIISFRFLAKLPAFQSISGGALSTSDEERDPEVPPAT